MGFLNGKKLLITGVISNRSIAYGIAKACRREGAELAFTYANERYRERIEGLAADFDSKLVYRMDVGSDEDIAAVVEELGKAWGGLDGFVHSIGFAPREAIAGRLPRGPLPRVLQDRHGHLGLLLSCDGQGLPAAHEGPSGIRPHADLPRQRARRSQLQHDGPCQGGTRVEHRYLAASLGREGIRANAISAGPIKTLAASGIQDFGKLLHVMEQAAPLGRTVTTEEVGNTAAFLLSDLASGLTGDVVYVDAGFHAMGAAMIEVEK